FRRVLFRSRFPCCCLDCKRVYIYIQLLFCVQDICRKKKKQITASGTERSACRDVNCPCDFGSTCCCGLLYSDYCWGGVGKSCGCCDAVGTILLSVWSACTWFRPASLRTCTLVL